MKTEDRLRKLTEAARAESTATQAEWNDFVRRGHKALYLQRAVALGAFALIGIGAFAANALTSDGPFSAPRPQPVGAPSEPGPVRAADPPMDVNVPASEAELWFVQDERLSWGTTVTGGEVPATLAGDDPIAQRAAFWLQTLFGGPTGPDHEVGATSAIPSGTRLLGVSRADSVLTVDVSPEFESGGDTLSMQLRMGQAVYTGTQFPAIEAVRILVQGEPVGVTGREGLTAAEALTRRDFQDVAPFIVLESPRAGQEIASPVTVTGFANVFESNVNIRIRDANGKVILETWTTATCGTGCWGDFSETVAFEVPERQQGRLQVLTYSAEDGSEQDVVSIPVTLEP
ncbi:hypothetical protein BH24ACT26_BH24ACT26_22070 [soil metagenome]